MAWSPAEFELVGEFAVDVVVNSTAIVEIDRDVVPFAVGWYNGICAGGFADSVEREQDLAFVIDT